MTAQWTELTGGSAVRSDGFTIIRKEDGQFILKIWLKERGYTVAGFKSLNRAIIHADVNYPVGGGK